MAKNNFENLQADGSTGVGDSMQDADDRRLDEPTLKRQGAEKLGAAAMTDEEIVLVGSSADLIGTLAPTNGYLEALLR